MIRGFNKWSSVGRRGWRIESYGDPSIQSRSCIFLSHQHEDKPACVEISRYISLAGIDYYLDVEDPKLQVAAAAKDPVEITSSIKEGITSSTHMMVVVSQRTWQSPWVAFEVGYGQAILVASQNAPQYQEQLVLSVLTLKDLALAQLPDFMKLAYPIRGASTLNEFIAKLLRMPLDIAIRENRIQERHKMGADLDSILLWNR